MMISRVRLCFAHLFEPKAIGDGKPRYSAAFPIEPNSENAKALAAAVQKAAVEKWGDRAAQVLAKLIADGRVGFKKSPLTNGEGEVYSGFEGMWSLNASNESRPTVVDGKRNPITAEDGKIYSGCYVNVIVEVWAQDNQWGKRINATLKGVQFVADGEVFGGGKPASPNDFQEIEEGGAAANLDDLM